MLGDLMGLAWRNMQHARIRLMMTGLGVLVGTAAVVLLVALTIGLQRVAESSVGSNALLTEVTVYPSEQSTFDENRPTLDDEALALFREIEGVGVAIPLVFFNRRAELRTPPYSNYADLYGVPPDALNRLGVSVESGDLALPEAESVIYGGFVPQYFLDPEAEEYDPQTLNVLETDIELYFQRFDEEERFVTLQPMAVLLGGTSRWDNAIIMPLDTVLEYNNWVTEDSRTVSDVYSEILIRTESREFTRSVTNTIREMGYATDEVGDILEDLNSFFVSMRLVLGLTGGIALLVAAFVVANTMMMSVVERTAVIGLMKAIGARNRDVLAIFLFEAGLVGFSGGCTGILTASVLGNMINDAIANNQSTNNNNFGFLPINSAMLQGGDLIIIPFNLMLFAIGLATLVGLISGFFPAWRAAQMPPVSALRR